MAKSVDWVPIRLSLEEVTMRASHKVLVEVDDNQQLIIGDQQGILVQQLKTHPIH